ncbi:MAG TPA: hypothetical protein VJ184_10000 [Chryseolinea sp.]|nr:hypothetical protein [Chryseolinea sp.]
MKKVAVVYRHNVAIKATPETIYKAITTQKGLESWWAKQSIAAPEVGFVNIFTFGKSRNEMKVSKLTHNKRLNGIASIRLNNGLIPPFLSTWKKKTDVQFYVLLTQGGEPSQMLLLTVMITGLYL